MTAQQLLDLLWDAGVRFATGVPDSLLSGLAGELAGHASIQHVVAASEGAAIGLAAGHCLGTGRRALVYMQNSGLGNALNPLLSMCHPAIYDLPAILVIGWRGEPGRPDEPQHLPTGAATTSLLELLGIPWFALRGQDPAEPQRLREWLAGRPREAVAVLASAHAIPDQARFEGGSHRGTIDRSAFLDFLLQAISPDDAIFAGIGHVGRELLELRKRSGRADAARDFLCVGAMGHASQLAVGFALARPDRRVWCLDGDGAFTMHMGSCSIVSRLPGLRLVHVLFDNGVHASVGGSEVCGRNVDYASVAKAAGYVHVAKVASEADIADAVQLAGRSTEPSFLWVRVSAKGREGLPRPGNDLTSCRDHFRRLIDDERPRAPEGD